ncbi:MAG: hypothetical protein JST54_35615, partial [Deltaproteobacteria bacterium]|nr:hypothetical protein [Deltaproteobacteria bacterium]
MLDPLPTVPELVLVLPELAVLSELEPLPALELPELDALVAVLPELEPLAALELPELGPLVAELPELEPLLAAVLAPVEAPALEPLSPLEPEPLDEGPLDVAELVPLDAPADATHRLPVHTSFAPHVPQLTVPPQPSGVVPQFSPAGHAVSGVQPHT